MSIVPRPPPAKNMVEFIVEVFAVTIATLLILGAIGIGVFVIWRPSFDVGPLLNALTDIMTTIIGALIGFVAGRGHGVSEAKADAAAAKALTQSEDE